MNDISRRKLISQAAGTGSLGLLGMAHTANAASVDSARTDRSALFGLSRSKIGPYFGGTQETKLLDADVGFIKVPADHFAAGRSSQEFTLRFCRFRARRKTGAPPVFCFFGGPDWRNDFYLALEAGRADNPKWQFINMVTESADLVLIDHRGGAGCIYPKLMPLAIVPNMPLDRPLHIQERGEMLIATNERIIDVWREAGIHLEHFSTPQLARDVEAIRSALGYGSIRLIADSNGTYRCREYLRQFHKNVSSALLFISHAYRKSPDARHVEKALRRIDAAVAKDTGINQYVSSVSVLLDDISRRLDRDHPTVTIPSPTGDGEARITLGAEDLVPYFWSAGGEEPDIRSLPGKLWKMKNGDLSELALSASSVRTFGHGTNLSACELAFSGSSMPANWADNRSYAGDRLYLSRELSDSITSAWPLNHDGQNAFRHNVPITYVQGEWDIKTPVEAVLALKEPSAKVHVVPNMAHSSSIDGGEVPFWEKEIVDAHLKENNIPRCNSFTAQFNRNLF